MFRDRDLHSATSIKPLRFAGISDELADAVGLYEAAAMDFDDIDTTILDPTFNTAHAGSGEDIQAIEEDEVEEFMNQRALEGCDEVTAPETPPLDMAFTSSSSSNPTA